jgi:hypothetical protein
MKRVVAQKEKFFNAIVQVIAELKERKAREKAEVEAILARYDARRSV